MTDTNVLGRLGGGEDGQLLILDQDGEIGLIFAILNQRGRFDNLPVDVAALDLGSENTPSVFRLHNSHGSSFELDGVHALLILGSEGQGGDVWIRDSYGRDALRFEGDSASLSIGNRANAGDLKIYDDDLAPVLAFSGEYSLLSIGSSRNGGGLVINDDAGRQVFNFTSQVASLTVGSGDNKGEIRIRDDQSRITFSLDGGNATLRVGADGNEGDIRVTDNVGRDVLNMNGKRARLTVGAQGNGGDLRVMDSEGRKVLDFAGASARLRLGAPDHPGLFTIADNNDKAVIRASGENATLMVGNEGHAGFVSVQSPADENLIILDGSTGVIFSQNGDVAEEFDFSGQETVEPGMVVVFDQDGNLTTGKEAYDKRVAGIVAGAMNSQPALLLGRSANPQHRHPVALNGRVYCRVDAGYGEIQVGDLLTTSETQGHAMKAANPQLSFGAVLGKAMASLPSGQGMIPVLVALQ